jgi:hypothetical protein
MESLSTDMQDPPDPLLPNHIVCCRGGTVGGHNHRDRYLEQQQTEKIETEVRDINRIRITKVYA